MAQTKNISHYIKWFTDSWNQLLQDFNDGIFVPQNENDIQSHLYHTLWLNKLENRKILTELPFKMKGKTRKLDLALFSKDDEPRLYIEIKETNVKNLGKTKTTKPLPFCNGWLFQREKGVIKT